MHGLSLALFFAVSVMAGRTVAAQQLSPDPPAPLPVAQQEQPPFATFPGPGKREPSVKTVSGQVVNGQGTKLPDALVHLTNKNTHEEITVSTDKDGKYSFRDLDRNDDYDLRAEYKGASSPTKTVSSFDNRDNIYLQLEIPSH